MELKSAATLLLPAQVWKPWNVQNEDGQAESDKKCTEGMVCLCEHKGCDLSSAFLLPVYLN